MGRKFSNNASSSLAGTLLIDSTSATLATGDGIKFPTLGAGDWFNATITKLVGAIPAREIVKVTARAGEVLTIVRAQEGTMALEFTAGDKIDVRVTAAAMNGKMDKEGGEFTGPVTLGAPVTIQSSVSMPGQELSGAVMRDWADKVKVLAPGVNTIDYRDGKYQVWSPGSGPQTLTITNWPPAGAHGELWIEGVNLGAATITTSVALDYLKTDGTYATTTSLNANQGATLRAIGIDNVLIWGREGAPKRAKVAR